MKKLCYDAWMAILLNPDKHFALYLKITDSYIINLRVHGLERCPSLEYQNAESTSGYTCRPYLLGSWDILLPLSA